MAFYSSSISTFSKPHPLTPSPQRGGDKPENWVLWVAIPPKAPHFREFLPFRAGDRWGYIRMLTIKKLDSHPDRDESQDDLAVPPWFPPVAGTSLQRSAVRQDCEPPALGTVGLSVSPTCRNPLGFPCSDRSSGRIFGLLRCPGSHWLQVRCQPHTGLLVSIIAFGVFS